MLLNNTPLLRLNLLEDMGWEFSLDILLTHNISSSILMVLEILNYDVLENIIVNLELLKLEINMHYELRICELNYQRIVPT